MNTLQTPPPVICGDLVRRWVDWPGDECESCGGPSEIFTEEEEGFARDGDRARCLTCGTKGAICCDSESPAGIAWDDDEDSPNVHVRRFVVQERYFEKTECDWYDDPDISESVTLEDARTRLEKDLRESRGHGDAYLHRIIERTERVVQSPNA